MDVHYEPFSCLVRYLTRGGVDEGDKVFSQQKSGISDLCTGQWGDQDSDEEFLTKGVE